MASTARDIMTRGVLYVQEDETILDVAKIMDQLGVGAVPGCDNSLR